MWLIKISNQFMLNRLTAASSFSAMMFYVNWLFRSSAIVAQGGAFSALRQRIQFMWAGWRNQDLLCPVASAEAETPFARRMKTRPSILDAVVHPYQSTNWSARTRLTKLRAHYEAMARLRWLFDPHEQTEVTLCTMPDIHPDLRLVLDEAIWFKNEGPLVLSLFVGTDRIFSIAFALREENGCLVAHVGAVQGRNPADLPDILGCYRDLTRSAQGMRPRDLLIELFRTLCSQLDVAHILLVSDRCQQHRDPYFGSSRNDVVACYDGVWLERGAVRIDETMFELPVQGRLRAADEVPPRKRALYRRRYEMLARIYGTMADNIARSAALAS